MSIKPRVLFIDIETAPLVVYSWGIRDQFISHEQIIRDWFVLSWAAKWLGNKEVLYADQRNSKRLDDDKKLLAGAWDLLDQADIVVAHNGKGFDQPRLNARFKFHKFQPPSSYKLIDTLKVSRKHFGFTSHKLDYISHLLTPEHAKDHHKEFPGLELWKEVEKGNPKAWAAMEKYNKQDVIALEAAYKELIPWDNAVNFAVYSGRQACSCGSKDFQRRGYYYTPGGKFQRYRCTSCGAERRATENLLKGKVKFVGTVR